MDDKLQEVSAAVMIFGAAMIILRFVSYSILERLGLLSRLGGPRLFFFSDLLPFRLLFLKDASVGAVTRLVFSAYAFSYAAFLVLLIIMIFSLPGR